MSPTSQPPANIDYPYGVDGVRYHSSTNTLTGAQIKAKIANFDPAYQLFLEGEGGQPDQLINDSQTVDLSGTPKLFYTAPPATFGK